MTTMRSNPCVSSRHMRGLSLVELMIAMTLGLATIAAIGWIYLGTTKTYRTQDSLARLQEGARYAFEVIGNDLRMTGSAGCSYKTFANVINNYDTHWFANLFEQPVLGEEQDATGDFKLSDGLRVLHADVSKEYRVTNHDSGAGLFTVNSSGLASGDLLLATDCSHAAVFQASGASATTISHGATGTPGNSTSALGSGGVAYTFADTKGARLYRLSGNTYYVATNPAGEPSLYRSRPTGLTATVAGEELVEGVEDMQVTYGADTDAVADGFPDAYLTADEVDTTVPGASEQDRWNRVVSMHISLLMRTVEDNIVPTPQTYNYNGASVTATDRRLRKVVTHVIKMRNR